MSDEQFTNRHGHTISALQEAVNDLPEPEYRADVPVRPAKRRKRRAFRPTPLQIRIVLILLAIIILTPILVGEYVRGSYDNNVGVAKDGIKNLFASVLTQQNKSVTSKTLLDVNVRLSVIKDGLCPGGFLDNLAKLYPRAQQSYDNCATYRSTVAALQDSVSVAAAQMAYLEQLQPLLTSVSQPLEDPFAVLSSQQENCQAFVAKLNRLPVPASFAIAHTGLTTQASAIHDQWIALVQASNVFDSTAFNAARTKLTDSFTAFRATATAFTDVVNVSQSALAQDVTALQ
jgi:hypothetical protein